jgi:hypothetical protein
MNRRFEVVTSAYNSSFLPSENKSLNDGDKIILNERVLRNLMTHFGNKPLPELVLFEIGPNYQGSLKVHCGVLEFSAPEISRAYLPLWMMQYLGLRDGDSIKLRLKQQLPRGTKVTFQPQESKFARISNPSDTLAYALNKYVSLTEGSEIVLKHSSETYKVKVISVEPKSTHTKDVPAAICIVDTQLEVEFQSVPAGTDEKQVEFQTFGLDAPAQGRAGPTQPAHFKFKVVDAKMMVRFRVSASGGGRAGLYASSATTPSLDVHTWAASSSSGDSITISPTHKEYKPWFFLAVYGLSVEVAFNLRYL